MNNLDVTDLMTTNAGDEFHRPENWQKCPSCRREYRVDYENCPWGCDDD